MRASRMSLIVLGAAGKMGTKVLEHIKSSPDCILAGAFDLAPGPGIQPPGHLKTALKKADAAIEFTAPEAAAAYARICAELAKPLVIGTTGFNGAQLTAIKNFSKTIPVFLSPNMSPAVNLTFAVAKLMARKLGSGFDIHISETHHKRKKDAPSGTALKYLAHIKEAYDGSVTVTSIRAGDIVGEHAVLYAGPYERVELIHRAHSRDVFAQGAVKAALWLADRKPGLYDYLDLLGLKKFGEHP
ncbi:MAG: 4-hydroxy-tetrahydrodipicolinate reductase [Elusimicrobia bacterium]|nr:4-hydroxy-tetrahydrodipicolinate reductase [Elusimicrobiota bacterium]